MIENLPSWSQTIIFIGLTVVWMKLFFDIGKWFWSKMTDDGMM